MSAQVEIRSKAELFGWEQRDSCNVDEDIFIRGDQGVIVGYRRDGVIQSAVLYLWRGAAPVERERAPEKLKKPTVIAWLAAA